MGRISISVHDRTGRVQSPFDIRTFPGFEIPAIPAGFNLSYEEAVLERAAFFKRQQERLGVPIFLMYSGGIDSTVMLLALEEVMGGSAKDRIEVALTRDSIAEYPRFYNERIRGRYQMVSSELFAYQFDRSRLVISGEHNDQLFGSDVLGDIVTAFGDEAFELALQPYTRDRVVDFLVRARAVEPDIANFWFEMVDGHLRSHSEVEATRLFDFFWWLNFVFKWQNVYFRILMRVAPHLRHNIGMDFLSSHFFHFFSSEELQCWSMRNPAKKVNARWNSYKAEAKEFIRARTGDDYYADNKVKRGSLWRLFLQGNSAGILTTDFKYMSVKSDPMIFYRPDNSFV